MLNKKVIKTNYNIELGLKNKNFMFNSSLVEKFAIYSVWKKRLKR